MSTINWDNKSVGVRAHVNYNDIANLLDEASRGSRYWCGGVDALGYEKIVAKILDGGTFLVLSNVEEEDLAINYQLSLAKIKKGLTVMLKKAPEQFADILKDDTDDNTGDVFLQCCLLGEVIYG